ncbi:uncharacterized protein DSM5745_09893 [Aspergillus mulundensis]|uniref:Uncharacterized protein n=1 Tax=Aspergillus mulundensis TaxID=1810919 RepID=A0A3D8QRQ7_9EURO|nr:hypothetical protein DSM5745_09893 [Aspergillus mulundensis]RDW64482.1 hypothetical protein DSM5745_09893 [Aspergillus mulundensis]
MLANPATPTPTAKPQRRRSEHFIINGAEAKALIALNARLHAESILWNMEDGAQAYEALVEQLSTGRVVFRKLNEDEDYLPRGLGANGDAEPGLYFFKDGRCILKVEGGDMGELAKGMGKCLAG